MRHEGRPLGRCDHIASLAHGGAHDVRYLQMHGERSNNSAGCGGSDMVAIGNSYHIACRETIMHMDDDNLALIPKRYEQICFCSGG